jgi:hypothetical protein
MASNSDRRTVPSSWEMSPPRTRRESVLEVENMSVRDLERHITNLQDSIDAMRKPRGHTVPPWNLAPTSDDVTNEDHRHRFTPAAYDSSTTSQNGCGRSAVDFGRS